MERLGARLRALGPAPNTVPDVSVVIPVNACGDLANVLHVLGDVARYAGRHTMEIVLVVNNFPEGQPPRAVDEFRRLGARVVAVPQVRRPGEAPGFTGRVHGARAARSECVVLFDADCRIPHITPLVDWYVEQFRCGAAAAYTHVAYYDFVDAASVRVRLTLHHASRWMKRRMLGIPTTRGSNYAVRRTEFLDLYERGFLADEMNVGPAFKRLVGPVAYSGAAKLTVFTSGRMFRARWRRIVPLLLVRLRYNLRTLPVRPGAAQRTGRADPIRRYDENNRPIRT
jgi:hypothetical protein